MKDKILSSFSALILGLAFCQSCRENTVKEVPAVPVTTQTASTVTDGFQRIYTGDVSPARNTLITAPYPGTVSSVLVHKGQAVKKGQVMPGMVAKVSFSRSGETGIVIPAKAVLMDLNGRYVWIAKDGKAQRREVTVDQLMQKYEAGMVPLSEILKARMELRTLTDTQIEKRITYLKNLSVWKRRTSME